MARYILIDIASGYIAGDTADIGGHTVECGSDYAGVVSACRAIGGEIGTEPRCYEIVSSSDPTMAAGSDGYLVYRADVRGSEQVTVITDGQDQEMIDAVHRDCELAAVVVCRTVAAECQP